jgi:NAD(P)-dependent dehydrogenase (short-subunit alcohol dehydrogenase family)
MGRIGRPEDIAAVVAFLLSDDAGYMTGQSVAANGGAIMVADRARGRELLRRRRDHPRPRLACTYGLIAHGADTAPRLS